MDSILKLRKQLLPTGRAFRVPDNGVFDKLLTGRSMQSQEVYSNALSLLYSIIPDNDYFSADDAARWEKALAVTRSDVSSIVNRKQAIYRKMQFPSNVKGRQHKNYLEHQLREAGFNCKIYEWDEVKNMGQSVMHSPDTVHDNDTIHGNVEYPSFSQIVAKYINPDDEIEIPITLQNLQNVFWIAGETFSDLLNVRPHRLEEFRNIILTIKPLYTVGFLRITTFDSWILETGHWDFGGVWTNDGLWKS